MWSNWRTAPTKWDALQPPPRRISAEEAKAIELLEELFAGENGYDIARFLKPRMTSQPLQMITEPGDYKVISLPLFLASAAYICWCFFLANFAFLCFSISFPPTRI
jgi:hypothetical protein